MQNFKHWIFDLDGTLTKPVHNFDEIRTSLGVPKGKLILEHIESLNNEKKFQLKQRLAAIEESLAEQSCVAAGANSLLNYLQSMGHDVAILTRNTRENALLTLRTIKLLSYFPSRLIVGREDTNPKPSKDAVVYLLQKMKATVSKAVIVGDHRIDLQTGRNSSISTIHIFDKTSRSWPALTDYRFPSLTAVLKALKTNSSGQQDK